VTGLAQELPDTFGLSFERHAAPPPHTTAGPWPDKSLPSPEWPITGLPETPATTPLTTHRSVVLRRVAETPRRPNGFVPRSVAPDCRATRRPTSPCRGRCCPAERAGFPAGRVVGKEYVRTGGAFLTNDVAAVRPGAGWSSSGRTFSTGQTPRTAAVRDCPTTGALRVLSRNRRRRPARNGPLGAAMELPCGCCGRAPTRRYVGVQHRRIGGRARCGMAVRVRRPVATGDCWHVRAIDRDRRIGVYAATRLRITFPVGSRPDSGMMCSLWSAASPVEMSPMRGMRGDVARPC
jgi:hypothetical protein